MKGTRKMTMPKDYLAMLDEAVCHVSTPDAPCGPCVEDVVIYEELKFLCEPHLALFKAAKAKQAAS
jgi:hypothetical protein